MSKLESIAQGMRTAAASKPFGYTTITLKGLEIVLSHIGERWRLAMRRQTGWPSETEIEILRRAFRVAEGSEPKYSEEHRRAQITGTPIMSYVVEIQWTEL